MVPRYTTFTISCIFVLCFPCIYFLFFFYIVCVSCISSSLIRRDLVLYETTMLGLSTRYLLPLKTTQLKNSLDRYAAVGATWSSCSLLLLLNVTQLAMPFYLFFISGKQPSQRKYNGFDDKI